MVVTCILLCLLIRTFLATNGSVMAGIIFWLLLTGVGSIWGRNVAEMAGNKSLSLAILAPVQYMQRSIASFSVALEEVERRQLLPGYSIYWKLLDTDCNAFKGGCTTEQ